MNIDHRVIDRNTFVVLNDKGEEITYKHNEDAASEDIFAFIFIENEIEYREKNVVDLKNERKQMKVRLLNLKNDLRAIKKMDKKIKSNKEFAIFLKNRMNSIKNDCEISEVSRKVKKLSK